MVKFLYLAKTTCICTYKTYKCKHDQNPRPSIQSDSYYTPKHKQRQKYMGRHMRELKCTRSTHEHKDKNKKYTHSQQKAHTQDRKVTDTHEWCGWVQWGNTVQGDTMSGHGSAHMGTDDLYFASMTRGGQQEQNQHRRIRGEKTKKENKKTQRAHTSPRHCICNAKHNGSSAKRATEKRNRPKQHSKQNT